MGAPEVQTEQGKQFFHKFIRTPSFGPGRVDDKFPFGDTTAPGSSDITSMDRLLYDFDIDWPELKDPHRAWIAKAVKFLKKDFEERSKTDASYGAWEIRIDGYASKTFKGPDLEAKEHNELLSNRRKLRVADQFRINLNPTFFKFIEHFHGFNDLPVPGTGEYEKHRSVRVVVQRPGLPPPKPITLPPVPYACMTNGPYRFKSLAGPSISLPLDGGSAGVAWKDLKILDAGCNKIHTYRIWAVQGGIGFLPKETSEAMKRAIAIIKGIIQGGKTQGVLQSPTPWGSDFIQNPIRVDLVIGPNMFEGPIRIQTLDAGAGMGLTGSAIIFTQVPSIGPLEFAIAPANVKGIFLVGGADFMGAPGLSAVVGTCKLVQTETVALPNVTVKKP